MNPNQPLILVVDDCDYICEGLAAAFEAKQLRCKIATDGATALDLVRGEAECPAVAIVAYHLSDATGAETTRCLKLLCPNTTVFGTSKEHTMRLEMLGAGAIEFFEKPYDMHRLMLAVTNAIKPERSCLT